MSKWDEKFEKHGVHSSIDEVKEQTEALKEIDQLRENDRLQDFFRIERIMDVLENHLQLVDPEVINPNILDQISNELSKVHFSLNSYSSNPGNFSHLNNANKQVDSVIHRLNLLNTFSSEQDFESLTNSISSFLRSLGQHLSNLKTDIDNIGEQTPQLNKKLGELESEIQNNKERTDNIIGNFQEQFSEAQEKRQTEYSTNKEERQSTFNKLISKIEAKHNEELAKKKDEAENELEEIKGHKEKASKIVRIISNSSLGGGFDEVAANEKKARNWFRGGSIIALAVLIIFAWNVLLEFSDTAMGYTALGIRAFVAAVIGILITYLAKQAEKHERHYRKNKLTALQMATLDPYLSELDPEKQKQIKEELKEIFFYRKNEVSSELKKGEFETKGNLQDFLNFIKNITPKN
jgi:hypothetical protein